MEGASHDFWELERLGIVTVDYSERIFFSLVLTFLSRIIANVFNTDFVVHFQIDKNESGLTAIPAGYDY